MAYLICEKCGGYYRLKEGEDSEDFKTCECGGNLRYVQNFGEHFDEELDPINEFNICPDCGNEISPAEKYCKSCDKMIKDTKNKEVNSDTYSKSGTAKFLAGNLMLRVIAIIIGILIVVIPTFLFANSNYALLLLLIGGVVTSLIAGGKSEDGAINGIILGLIAALIILIFRGNFESLGDVVANIYYFVTEMGGAILILTLFGLVGGVIGVSIRDLLIKYKK